LKNALMAVKPSKSVEAKVTYMGAPKYLLNVVADDYKQAEKALVKIAEGICDDVKKVKGKGSYEIVEVK